MPFKKSVWQQASWELIISKAQQREPWRQRESRLLPLKVLWPSITAATVCHWHVNNQRKYPFFFSQLIIFSLWCPQDGFKYIKWSKSSSRYYLPDNSPVSAWLGRSPHPPILKHWQWLRAPTPLRTWKGVQFFCAVEYPAPVLDLSPTEKKTAAKAPRAISVEMRPGGLCFGCWDERKYAPCNSN